MSLTEEQRRDYAEAVKIMSPFSFKKIGENDHKEMLDQLYVFGKRTNEIIVSEGKDAAELDAVVSATIKAVTNMEQKLKAKNKLGQIHWSENKDEIQEEITSQFPELFAKVTYRDEQERVKSDLLNNLKLLERKLRCDITAKISNKREAETKKYRAEKSLNQLKQKVSLSLDTEYQSEVIEEINKTKDELFEFVDIKLKEEPVRLLYYKTGNRVSVKVNINRSSYCCNYGRKRSVRLNKGKDSDAYLLIVSVNYIIDFLYTNDIRSEDILIDPKSIDKFYTFGDEISVNLTPGFVDKWWNYDCPPFYRCEINKGDYTNALGEPLCHFSSQLVESSFSADYIDKRITKKEVSALTKGREHTRMAKTMYITLQAQKINDPKEVEDLREKVYSFDRRIQKVIDANKDKITERLAETFNNRVRKDEKGNIKFDDNFGLDCGFIFIQTTDAEYSKNRMLLSKISSNESHYMNIQLPCFSQSTTFQRAQFNAVEEIVLNELGIELYAYTQLD